MGDDELKLNAGERSVLAYFPTDTGAQACAKKLQALGVQVQVDAVNLVPGGNPERDYTYPGQRGEASVADAVLFGRDVTGSEDARVLLAAHPAVSGMSGGGPTAQYNYLVAVVCTEEQLPRVLAQVERDGGRH
jgi:hypothetical protein